MNLPEPDQAILTLEPLLESIRDGVERAGWVLSELQKTTSHELEGRWAGESSRCAYIFFYRKDLPESVQVEAFIHESSGELRSDMSLVVNGPEFGTLGGVKEVLDRVRFAMRETLPAGFRSPLAVRVSLPDAAESPEEADVELRAKLVLPTRAIEAGASAVSALSTSVVTAFERLLERPEVAELLPPVVD